MIFEECH